MRAPAWEGLGQRIYLGHALDVLREMPDESYQAVCCSPPYYSLRNYGTEPVVWDEPEGGCSHDWMCRDEWHNRGDATAGAKQKSNAGSVLGRGIVRDAVCARCGAMRCELGAEPDVGSYCRHLVAIFREVKRVLRADGIAWCVIADSYSSSPPGNVRGVSENSALHGVTSDTYRATLMAGHGTKRDTSKSGVPAKSLLLVPERLAIALSDDGWIVRSRICWAKTSAMPESVRDRPTSAWEHVWMLTRSERYFYDQDAVREACVTVSNFREKAAETWGREARLTPNGGGAREWNNPSGRNLRNFWLLGPEPLDEPHFAAYPSELARRCLKSSTSQAGCCPRCRAPWRRCVEWSVAGTRHISPKDRNPDRNDGPETGTSRLHSQYFRYSTKATRFAPSCSCDAGPPVPMRILDPFLGSGTTLVVARELGLEGWGIELNQAYVDIAARRVDTWQKVEDAADARGQARLFEVPA